MDLAVGDSRAEHAGVVVLCACMGKEGSFGAASWIPLPPLLFSNQQLTRASTEERRHAMAHMHNTRSDCGRVLHPGRMALPRVGLRLPLYIAFAVAVRGDHRQAAATITTRSIHDPS